MNEQGLIVFAKAPVAGKAKTRLSPAIGAVAAARIHAELVERTLESVTEPRWATALWCSPDSNDIFFQNLADKHGLLLENQQGENLGEKMYMALLSTLEQSKRAVIIGTDCPVLSKRIIQQAFSALRNNYDAVIIPAEDGGYVLLGLTRIDQQLFDDMAWGTNTVFTQTMSRLKQLGFNCLVLPTLWDIDRPEDLLRYQKLKG